MSVSPLPAVHPRWDRGGRLCGPTSSPRPNVRETGTLMLMQETAYTRLEVKLVHLNAQLGRTKF